MVCYDIQYIYIVKTRFSGSLDLTEKRVRTIASIISSIDMESKGILILNNYNVNSPLLL